MKNEYVTISEFARIIGISRQAVYSKLDKTVNLEVDKLTRVDKQGKKLISLDAIELFKHSEKKKVAKSEKEESGTVNQTVNQTVKLCQPNCQVDNEVESQEKYVSMLMEQLKEKDKIIDLLKEQITAKDRQIDSLLTSFQSQSKELTKLVDQQQQLQAMATKQLPARVVTGEESSKEKKGFFGRLFSRN